MIAEAIKSLGIELNVGHELGNIEIALTKQADAIRDVAKALDAIANAIKGQTFHE